MGLSQLATKSARLAFRLAGDLISTVTLVSKTSAEFDFNASSANVTQTNTRVLKALFVEKKKNKGDKADSTVTSTFQFLAEDLDNPSDYDQIIEANGKVWNIVTPFSSDGILININVASEV